MRCCAISLALAIAALGACSSAASPKAAEAPAVASADPDIGGDPQAMDPRGQIERLWEQIEQLRSGELAPDAVGPDSTAPVRTSTGTTSAGARPRSTQLSEPLVCADGSEPQTTRCSDVCTLARSVCANAESICRIAGQMPGDDWAAGKCTGANESCSEATEDCCACSAGDSE